MKKNYKGVVIIVFSLAFLVEVKSPAESDEKENAECFLENVRDKGTDSSDNVITRTKTIDAKGCQRRCQKREQCNFFLFFTPTHSQWYKRRECRLLKERGALEVNSDGHVSGPKNCKVTNAGQIDENENSLVSLDFQKDAFIESAFNEFVEPNDIIISQTCLEDYRTLNGTMPSI